MKTNSIIQAVALLLTVHICITLATETKVAPPAQASERGVEWLPFPPLEIRQIAWAMDMGYDVSDEAMSKLSRWMEDNPESWNAWCQAERLTMDH